ALLEGSDIDVGPLPHRDGAGTAPGVAVDQDGGNEDAEGLAERGVGQGRRGYERVELARGRDGLAVEDPRFAAVHVVPFHGAVGEIVRLHRRVPGALRDEYRGYAGFSAYVEIVTAVVARGDAHVPGPHGQVGRGLREVEGRCREGQGQGDDGQGENEAAPAPEAHPSSPSQNILAAACWHMSRNPSGESAEAMLDPMTSPVSTVIS